ncbi:related to TPO4-Proposed vacuolar polyamine transporter [Fusarium mangiferae]|uniref:Related to TPO4-Proposed vacuolar polyamine transporter n=1 Tax=Fusarium mangiferae TaxID=192010 RepID=A0A1L7UKV6_FUSMA|nr:uncharacterized protein FMAN_09755 [Fusarium mangiferae]CVL07856.1 related to TPO4-Proposed vacuolar polyamine transporter [Fusarium mangiferae]
MSNAIEEPNTTERLSMTPITGDEEARDGTKTRDDDGWAEDAQNSANWPNRDKAIMMAMVSLTAFVAALGSSIIAPAQPAIQNDFNVSETASLLPLSLYVFALAFGPIVGGPLSETVGRMPVYYIGFPLGMLFTLGAGLTHNFGALCFLRFMAGFAWSPMLIVAVGSISETFPLPQTRGPMMAVFILMPFLGPGLGPVLGAFAVSRQGWRWTQWVLLFFSIACLILIVLTKESFPPILKYRKAKRRGQQVPSKTPVWTHVRLFAQVALIRPVHMLFTEPIIIFICLYISVNFGILFSFFAAVPYTVETVYHFGIEQSGLVFLSVVIGCLLGMITISFCDIIFYRPQATKYAGKIPPEYRLYPAMVGSFGLPLGLFWFAWSSRSDISWAAPVVAIIPFAWGNLCVFVSTAQFAADTYHGNVVASASASLTLARYPVGGAFPLFVLQSKSTEHEVSLAFYFIAAVRGCMLIFCNSV